MPTFNLHTTQMNMHYQDYEAWKQGVATYSALTGNMTVTYNESQLSGSKWEFAYKPGVEVLTFSESEGTTQTIWDFYEAKTKQECLDEIAGLGLTPPTLQSMEA